MTRSSWRKNFVETRAEVVRVEGGAGVYHVHAKARCDYPTVCSHRWQDIFQAQGQWVLMARCPTTKQVFVQVQAT